MTEEEKKMYSSNAVITSERKQFDVIKSPDLFKGNREIYINHDDEIYKLSITKTGRLLLTK
jgi:hemin uptake protein HemP